jgi:carbamoyl-phosphate synthase small subunit
VSLSKPAYLATADGLFFVGRACGAEGQAGGELCFNTSMSGYQEIVTDPSYGGQIITMTAPQMGNYGVCDEDSQSRGVFARGLVVREMCHEPSNWRSQGSLPDYLRAQGVVAIEGIDTRAIVRHLRDRGAVNAVISTECSDRETLLAAARAEPGLVGRDLAATVACDRPYDFLEGVRGGQQSDLWSESCPYVSPVSSQDDTETPTARFRVVAFDTGIKYDILRNLRSCGCSVHVVPPTTSAEDVLAQHPDGIFLANGPGDPDAVDYLCRTVRQLIGRRPLFGICLGHQILSLAAGAKTYKLKFGHRGGNHPVMYLPTGRVEITAQNHGFAVDLDGTRDIELTHLNLNDQTVEGIRLRTAPAFSVQYHPEAAPGPHDAHYVFTEFTRLMEEYTQ